MSGSSSLPPAHRLGDPQDGVIAVALGAGVPVLAGLVEERVDLLAERREAQEPRPSERRRRRRRESGVECPPSQENPSARRERRVGLESP